MELFHEEVDALAIVRLRGGVFKQVKVYRRGDQFYVAVKGGYARVLKAFDDKWGTSCPDATVIDLTPSVARKIAARAF
jgi:hypothetical protein